jgi:hypothetical protein
MKCSSKPLKLFDFINTPQIKKNDSEKEFVVCLNVLLYAAIPAKRMRKITEGGNPQSEWQVSPP